MHCMMKSGVQTEVEEINEDIEGWFKDNLVETLDWKLY